MYDGPSDAPGAVVQANVSFDDDPLLKKHREEAFAAEVEKKRAEKEAVGVGGERA